MQVPDVRERFAALENKVPIDDYNLKHFRTKYLIRDGRRTFTNSGIMPGEIAPDFELPTSDGGTIRLSDLRGKPVLLTFSSYS